VSTDQDGVYVGFTVATYSFLDSRASLADATRSVAGNFAMLGYETHLFLDPVAPHDVTDHLDEFSDGLWDHRPLILYWTGHGVQAQTGEYLLAVRSTPRNPPSYRAFSPRRLVESALRKSPAGLILIVDACYAGDGLREIFEQLDSAARTSEELPWYAVVASASSSEQAVAGRMADYLSNLLANGPNRPENRYIWSNPYSAGVSGSVFVHVLADEWPYTDQQPIGNQAITASPVFIPRPAAEPSSASPSADPLVTAEDSARFIGRSRLLAEATAWLAEGQPGLRLLLGSAGSGKSAVLDQISRSGETGPAVVVSCRGRGEHDVIASITSQCGLTGQRSAYSLAEELRDREPRAILVDGLDEVPSEEQSPLAKELAVLATVQPVMVTSRDIPRRERRADEYGAPAGAPDYDDPIGALNLPRGVEPWVLDQEESTTADIKAYVQGLTGDDTLAGAVAAGLSGEDGAFLLARLVTQALADQPIDTDAADWENELDSAFARSFDIVFKGGPEGLPPAEVRALLGSAAFSFGSGLPGDEVWLASANALSGRGDFTLTDIFRLLESHRPYLVATGADGQAVYRLFHAELGSYIEAQLPEGANDIDRAIGQLWKEQSDGGLHPERAAPYIRRHGADHLARLGDEGMTLLDSLATTNPASYRPLLAHAHAAYSRHEFGRKSYPQNELSAAYAVAIAASEQAVDIYRGLYQSEPDTYRAEYADSLEFLTHLRRHVGEQGLQFASADAAINALEEVVGLYRALAASDADRRDDLSDALENLAGELNSAGRTDEALKALQEALAIDATLGEGRERTIAHRLNQQVRMLESKKRRKAALGPARQAVQLWRKLYDADPQWTETQFVSSLQDLSILLLKLGRAKAALAPIEEAIEIQKRMVAERSKDFGNFVPILLEHKTKVLQELQRWEQALATAADELARLRSANNDSPFILDALQRYRKILAKLERWDEVASTLEEEIEQVIRPLNEGYQRYYKELAKCFTELAVVRCRLRRWADAWSAFETAADLWWYLRERTKPKDDGFLLTWLRLQENRYLYISEYKASKAFRRLVKRFAAALGRQSALDLPIYPLERLVDLLTALIEEKPLLAGEKSFWTSWLNSAQSGFSAALMVAGRWGEAAAPEATLVDLLRHTVHDEPDAAGHLGWAICRRARAISASGETAAAINMMDEGISILRAHSAAEPSWRDTYLDEVLRFARLLVDAGNAAEAELVINRAAADNQDFQDLRPSWHALIAALRAAMAGQLGRRDESSAYCQTSIERWHEYLQTAGASASLISAIEKLSRSVAAATFTAGTASTPASEPGSSGQVDIPLLARWLDYIQIPLLLADRQGEAEHLYQETIEGLTDGWAAYVLLDRLDRQPGRSYETAAREAIRAGRLLGEPSALRGRAQRTWRSLRWRDPDSFDRIWREHTAGEVPRWLALTKDEWTSAETWLRLPTWRASKTYAEANPAVTGETTDVVLAELAAEDPDDAAIPALQELLLTIRTEGLQPAYRLMLASEYISAGPETGDAQAVLDWLFDLPSDLDYQALVESAGTEAVKESFMDVVHLFVLGESKDSIRDFITVMDA
jgi:hypothetical protein